MPDRQAPSTSNSSRTAAKVAVAVLIVIAIAGFVLAGLRSRTPPTGEGPVADATQEGGSSPTAAAASAAPGVDDGVGPSAVSFTPGSDRLSSAATAKVQHLAETARKENRRIAIQARIESRNDRAEQMDLARKRALAVRHVFEESGIALGTLQIEISELPAGGVPAALANRVDVVFR